MLAAETAGSESRSSRTASATSRSASSDTSPATAGSGASTPTLMAGVRSVICSTFGSSASTGKLGIRSTSERISASDFCTFLTLSRSSNTQKPTPSWATLVTFLIPSTLRQASSIFWQMPSSTSSGVAPGYGTVTRTISSSNSGNTSRRIVANAPAPTRSTATTSVFMAGMFRIVQEMMLLTCRLCLRSWRRLAWRRR